MLDVGCGTGVPTLFILDKLGGEMTALDTDPDSLQYLREKAREQNLLHKLTTLESSVFDLEPTAQFDLILAEGLLNIVGFEPGFLKLLPLIKKQGFLIIHDEFQGQQKKINFVQSHDCEVLETFELDEQIWWRDHYRCLQHEISQISDTGLLSQFKSEQIEIEAYHRDPSDFQSIYYIIKRN